MLTPKQAKTSSIIPKGKRKIFPEKKEKKGSLFVACCQEERRGTCLPLLKKSGGDKRKGKGKKSETKRRKKGGIHVVFRHIRRIPGLREKKKYSEGRGRSTNTGKAKKIERGGRPQREKRGCQKAPDPVFGRDQPLVRKGKASFTGEEGEGNLNSPV